MAQRAGQVGVGGIRRKKRMCRGFQGRVTTGMGCSKVRAWSIAALAATMSLTACSSEEPAAQPSQPTNSVESSGVQVPNPKDATAVDPCDMLTEQTAVELGLRPKGRPSKQENSCQWASEDFSLYASLSPIENRSIQEYYENKSTYADYGELTIAEHPAVRANRSNPTEDGHCDIFLAKNSNQVLYATARDSSYTDPCSLAQKSLEAAIPNLPSAN